MAAKKEEESLWDLGVASSIGEISAIRKKKKKRREKSNLNLHLSFPP